MINKTIHMPNKCIYRSRWKWMNQYLFKINCEWVNKSKVFGLVQKILQQKSFNHNDLCTCYYVTNELCRTHASREYYSWIRVSNHSQSVAMCHVVFWFQYNIRKVGLWNWQVFYYVYKNCIQKSPKRIKFTERTPHLSSNRRFVMQFISIWKWD